MAKQHTSRMPFQTRTPIWFARWNIAESADSPPDQRTYVLQEISQIDSFFFFYIVKNKRLTLFPVNCAADSKMYRGKYRGNHFFFFFLKIAHRFFLFSIRHFWHKVRGRDHWTKLCA